MRRFLSYPVPLWAVVLIAVVALGLGGAASTPTEEASSTTTTTGVLPPRLNTDATLATLPTTTTVPEVEREVARFTGSSTKNTPNFTVKGEWKLSWTVTGGAGIGVSIYDSVAQLEFLQADPGSDESIFRFDCPDCFLKLSPYGSSYTVIVTDLPG